MFIYQVCSHPKPLLIGNMYIATDVLTEQICYAKITANTDLYCSVFSLYIFRILVVSLQSRRIKIWKIYRLNTE